MARKKKRFGLFVGIFVLLAIILVSGFFFVQQTAFTGSSLLSLSQVDLRSNVEFFSGQAWVYTFKQGSLSQKAIGIVDDTSVADVYDGSERPKEDFELDVIYDSQDCVYNINQVSDKPIYTYSLTDGVWKGLPSYCENNPPSCSSGSEPEWILYTGPSIGTKNCYALCKTARTGAVGVFGSPNIDSKFTVFVKAKGQSYSKSFSTLTGSDKGFVGENAYVVWQGNLNSGIQCKDKDPYKPVYVSGSWRIVNEQYYQDYRSAAISLENTDSNEINLIRTSIDQVNSYANKAMNSVSFADSFVEKTSLSKAQVIVTPQTPLQYPVITAYIKASWIGIYTPVGKPSITSATSDCFKSSSDGIIKAVVKNIGSERDVFNVYATCKGIFTSADKVSVSLEPDASRTVYVRISADTDEKKLDTCTVYAEGTVSTAYKEVSVCVDPQVTCNPGSLTCADGNIVKCSSDGVRWQLSESCSDGCKIAANGKPYCAEDPAPPGPAPGECYLGGINIFGKNFFGVKAPDWVCEYNITLTMIFGAIIGLIVWLAVVISFNFLPEKKKTSPALTWILGFLAGALVFLAFYLLFWIGIIVAVIVFVLSNVIKKAIGKKG